MIPAGLAFGGGAVATTYGYYDQSMTLIRSSVECRLTAQHAGTHPETVKCVLGRRICELHSMAIDLGQIDQWRRIYKALSNFAHPSGARAQVSRSLDGTPVLPMGRGDYDQQKAVAILQALGGELFDLQGLAQMINVKFGDAIPAGTNAEWRRLQDLIGHLREKHPHYFAQTT